MITTDSFYLLLLLTIEVSERDHTIFIGIVIILCRRDCKFLIILDLNGLLDLSGFF